MDRICSTITECKLTNGKILEYDACSKNLNAYDKKVFYYIGQGIIYKIDGVKQKYKSEDLYYFFKYKK